MAFSKNVFLYINKIRNYFNRLLSAKICWTRPKNSEVLVFDANNVNVFLPYIKKWAPEILYVRGEQLNVWSLIACLFRKGKVIDSYIDSYIGYVKPRLIITFIDNNPNFFKISKRHSNIKTLFIQNGWRSYHADVFEFLDKLDLDSLNEFYVDHMLSFGTVSGKKFSNYLSGTVTTIGSIKNNSLSRKKTVQPNVLAFISQWHMDGFYINDSFYDLEKYTGQVDRIVLKCLDDYAKKFNKKLMIIPRNANNSESRRLEEAYFYKLIGHDVEFLEPEGEYSSYQACDIAEVVVAIDTTLGYESIARGNKTAMFSIRSNILNIKGLTYGWPGEFKNEGLYWTNNPEPSSFIRILDYLFSVNESQWKEDLDKTNFSSLMSYNSGNSIFTEIIKKEVEALSSLGTDSIHQSLL